jgi:hypothetical protein
LTFVLKVQAAISGLTDQAPPAYVQYTIEHAFWENLGWTYRDLRSRPRKQIADYTHIMRIEANERKKAAARAQAPR